MDFDKSDFNKEAPTVSCDFCGSKQQQFYLIREPFIKQNFHNVLMKNIFSEVDDIAINISNLKRAWNDKISALARRKSSGENLESSKAALDIFQYIGDEDSYNRHLLGSQFDWQNELKKFYRDVGGNNVEVSMTNFLDSLRRGSNGNKGSNSGVNWYTNDSKEDAIANIREWINSNITPYNRNHIIQNELNTIAKRIYDEFGRYVPMKIPDWEMNYEKNSPKYLPDPARLIPQLRKLDVFEGVEYCNHCGAEQSRSLMIEKTFNPFHGEMGDEFAISYLGRIQDIRTDLIPQIETMWNEQLKEVDKRIKRVTKRWDSAEKRIQKMLDEVEEKQRREEIARLEEKLNTLKNKGKKD